MPGLPILKRDFDLTDEDLCALGGESLFPCLVAAKMLILARLAALA
jgi:hypothetical protein